MSTDKLDPTRAPMAGTATAEPGGGAEGATDECCTEGAEGCCDASPELALLESMREAAATLGASQAKALERLERIEGDFMARFRSDDKLQGAFDKLYVEMQQYKDDFLFQAQKPLLLDLVILHDHMCTAHDKAADEAKDAIDTLREQLLELLYRRDVEPMEFDPTAKFDRDRMKATRRETTTNLQEDWTVVRLLRQGFEWNKRVLRPHEVVVRRHGA